MRRQRQRQARRARREIIVATNHRRAFGGGHFPALDSSNVGVDLPDGRPQIVVDDLALLGGPVDPSADRNGTIQAVPGVAMAFRSGAAATRQLARHPDIRFVNDNGDGSASFELVGR